jgi:hypothetical protein
VHVHGSILPALLDDPTAHVAVNFRVFHPALPRCVRQFPPRDESITGALRVRTEAGDGVESRGEVSAVEEEPVTTPTRARRATLDSVCAEAVEMAREAALAAAPGEVGEHLGCEAEEERVVIHRFTCRNPAYRGWHWAVTISRAARARTPTVNETVLLPSESAVLAPAWVPWEDRLRPGDLGPGDILPSAEDDDRLLPGWAVDPADHFDPEAVEEVWMVAAEAGLVRPRVMSPIGRDDAIDRWYSGDRGPQAPIAMAAPDQCSTCGFLLAMGGSVGRMFGVCANEYAPDDGRVVSLDHGCGAHSEIVATPVALSERTVPVLDEIAFDVVVGEDGEVELVLVDEPETGDEGEEPLQ